MLLRARLAIPTTYNKCIRKNEANELPTINVMMRVAVVMLLPLLTLQVLSMLTIHLCAAPSRRCGAAGHKCLCFKCKQHMNMVIKPTMMMIMMMMSMMTMMMMMMMVLASEAEEIELITIII